ncbi:DUF2975 domain-containing protein [Aestuariivivens sediminicola]|uniref:DUF2975 domain-containing protein n=1 Tax=Aestuariivivens sediminicola TaxID=2913560 RepID=UPI001F55D11D|nr:DUF2975 domain-containing protein [Aestuariivivens sediminicola]
MKTAATLFLQLLIVLFGIVVLIFMIRFPVTEGRAQNLDLIDIYLDPIILYVYASSLVFYASLYKAFRLLGYIRNRKAFSLQSVTTLRGIKYYALILTVLIVIAGLYVRIFNHKDDDPAGFLATCIVTVLVALGVSACASILEKIVQDGVDITSENKPKS